jgi:predicted GNAT superfamily acetyltransferase
MEIIIRECATIEEFTACTVLQKEVFKMPDIEISPVRHLIVSKLCGGWTLGAFVEDRLVGFVHNLPALRGEEVIGYSHMTAIADEFQNYGIGAKLKWAQREKSLSQGRRFIKWTFEPMMARNAYFNLQRLGAIVQTYTLNFYGTELTLTENGMEASVLDSDRLFAEWELDSPRVTAFSRGEQPKFGAVVKTIEIPPNWPVLKKTDLEKAREEQLRVREEFQQAFAQNLICAGFERGERPKYLLFAR